MPTEFKLSGPMFDGRAKAAVDAFIVAATGEVADQGVNDVKQTLGAVLKHPTGYYESRIQSSRQRDDHVIDDGGVIYGPWLEGTSSRNQTTRFKGYATFRKVTQRLQAKSGDIAQRVIGTFLSRMQ